MGVLLLHVLTECSQIDRFDCVYTLAIVLVPRSTIISRKLELYTRCGNCTSHVTIHELVILSEVVIYFRKKQENILFDIVQRRTENYND